MIKIMGGRFTPGEVETTRKVLEALEAGACHAKETADDDVYEFAASVEEICVKRTILQLEDYVQRSKRG